MYQYDIEYCRRTGRRSFMQGLEREYRALHKRMQGVEKDAARCVGKARLDKTGLVRLDDRVRDFMARTFEGTMERRNRQFGLHAPDLEKAGEWAKAADAHEALAWFKRDVAAAYFRAQGKSLEEAGRKEDAERMRERAKGFRQGAEAHDKQARKHRKKVKR